MLQRDQRLPDRRLSDAETLRYSGFHNAIAGVEIAADNQVPQHVRDLVGDRYFPDKREGQLFKLNGKWLCGIRLYDVVGVQHGTSDPA